MTTLSKLTTAVGIALISAAISLPADADTNGRYKGPLDRQGNININVKSSAMQSNGSPDIFPAEYVTVRYSGSFAYGPSSNGWLTCSATADPCLASAGQYITPTFNVAIPGHGTRNVKGKDGQTNIIAGANGVVSTNLYDANHGGNTGSVKANVKVYQACFQQQVRVNIQGAKTRLFSVNMQGNWCVGEAKIKDAQTAIMGNPYNLSTKLNFQGTDMQSTNWWPSSSQKKRFVTTSFPQFGKPFSYTIPGVDRNTGLYAPSIKFDYHNNGTWRIRYFNGDETRTSYWYSVSSDRKTINI